MALDENLFKLDLEAEKNKRVELIKTTSETLQRSGVLVPVSGGLDSTTNLYLGIEAVGLDNVTAQFLPYRHVTEKETNEFIEDIKRDTGVNVIINDTLIDVLRVGKTPRFHDEAVKAARRRYESEIKMYYKDGDDIQSAPMNVHTGVILGCGKEHVDRAYSSVVAQHYFREAMAKTFAIRRNLLFVCCANLSEVLIGWYTKRGLDDTGDVKPISDLYKTQVRALANHIPIVESVRSRSPSSDMGIGKDTEIIKHEYRDIDFVLKGYLELGMTPKQISQEARIPIWTVVDVILKYRRSEHLRNGAYTVLDLDMLKSKTPNYFNCVDINKPK